MGEAVNSVEPEPKPERPSIRLQTPGGFDEARIKLNSTSDSPFDLFNPKVPKPDSKEEGGLWHQKTKLAIITGDPIFLSLQSQNEGDIVAVTYYGSKAGRGSRPESLATTLLYKFADGKWQRLDGNSGHVGLDKISL
jgi:hypothetical protein